MHTWIPAIRERVRAHDFFVHRFDANRTPVPHDEEAGGSRRRRVVDAGRAQGVPWEQFDLSLVLAGARRCSRGFASRAPLPADLGFFSADAPAASRAHALAAHAPVTLLRLLPCCAMGPSC